MPHVTYEIDPAHSSVQFSVRHMMLSNVRGEFTKVSGTITVDSENPANSTVDATIDATSNQHTRQPARRSFEEPGIRTAANRVDTVRSGKLTGSVVTCL